MSWSMENNNNNGGIISNKPFVSAENCTMDFDLNDPTPINSSQVAANNVQVPTLMGEFQVGTNIVPFQVPAMDPPQQGVHASSASNNGRQVHLLANPNHVDGDALNSGIDGRSINGGIKRKFDYPMTSNNGGGDENEMEISSGRVENVIDLTAPLSSDKVRAIIELQMGVVPAGYESAPHRRNLDQNSVPCNWNPRPTHSSKPKVVIKCMSDEDVMTDGYCWRKYGQKVIKNLGSPRYYYKCSFNGCNVRKHIERPEDDTRYVITTYEGKHNHAAPTFRKGYKYHGVGNGYHNNNNTNNAVPALVGGGATTVATGNNTGTNMTMMMDLGSSSNTPTPNMTSYYSLMNGANGVTYIGGSNTNNNNRQFVAPYGGNEYLRSNVGVNMNLNLPGIASVEGFSQGHGINPLNPSTGMHYLMNEASGHGGLFRPNNQGNGN